MSTKFYNISTITPFKGNVVAIWSADTKQQHQIMPDLRIPDGYIELVFIINGSYKRRKISTEQDSFVLDQSVIIGIQDKIIMSQNIGELKSIGLQFDPLQFYHLFGNVGIKARNAHIPITDSNQNELIQLNQKISKTGSIAEALKEIESFFAEYIPKMELCENWQLTKKSLLSMRNQKGNTSLEKIAKSGKINASTLSSNFKKFIGFTPEEMVEIIKINSTYEDPVMNESTSFFSIKDLFDDMKENESGELL